MKLARELGGKNEGGRGDRSCLTSATMFVGKLLIIMGPCVWGR